jgi:hypothetical protein
MFPRLPFYLPQIGYPLAFRYAQARGRYDFIQCHGHGGKRWKL